MPLEGVMMDSIHQPTNTDFETLLFNIRHYSYEMPCSRSIRCAQMLLETLEALTAEIDRRPTRLMTDAETAAFQLCERVRIIRERAQ